MKIKQGFILQEICGEKTVIAVGIENIDFNNLIRLSESAAFIWENFADKEFDAEILTKFILDNYDIDEETARHDCQEFCDTLIKEGIATL